MAVLNTPIEKGDILLSLPTSSFTELEFSRSVILIADQHSEGTVGFIINKALDITLNQLMPNITPSLTIYNGGPVENDKLFCIHSCPDLISNSHHIYNDLYWGGDFDQILTLLNQGILNKNNTKFFLGYTGWDYGQLNIELAKHFWLKSNSKINTKDFYGKHSKLFWKNNLKEFGSQYSIWQNAPENPNNN